MRNRDQKVFCLLQLRRVAALSESHPLDFADFSEVRLHGLILRFVMLAVDQQSRHGDLVDLFGDVPCLQRAGNEELGWAVPEALSACKL